jgi:uncharacterized protein with ParB-like and HNH nuclease domain
MKAERKTVSDLFSGDRQYIIPLFQRPYSWEKKQWEALWSDVEELLKSDNESNEHFFGPIVTQPTKYPPTDVEQYLLIDGQQRLTTLSLVLIALRERLKEFDADAEKRDYLVKQINKYSDNDVGTRCDYKILPTTTLNDRDIYMKLVKTGSVGQFSANRPMVQAYNFFAQKVRRVVINVSKAEELFVIIRKKLALVAIELDPAENPYTVFETLNYRGSPLKQTDLIRNYLFMLIDDEEKQNQVHDEHWKPVADYFGEKEVRKSHTFNDFFRYFLTARAQRLIKDTELYSDVKKTVKKEDLDDFWTQMYWAFDRYLRFVSPERETHPMLQKRLRRLKLIDVTVHFPLMLSLFDEYETGGITAEQLAECLFAVETFLVRDVSYRSKSQGLNKEFPSIYRKAKNLMETDFVSALKTAMGNISYYRNDDRFKSGLLDNPLFNSSKYLVKMMLGTIEEHLSGKELAYEDWDLDTMMPESLTPAWRGTLTPEDKIYANTYVPTLGNLILVPKGWQHSLRTFGEKKSALCFEGGLKTNQYFANLTRWDVQAIKDRSLALAEIALKVWPGFKVPRQYADNDKTGTKPSKLVVLGRAYYPKSWKEVYVFTLNRIYEVNPQGFKEIVNRYPNLFTLKPGSNLAYARLESGIDANVNFDANGIYDKCIQSMNIAGMEISEWQLEYA